MTTRRNDIKAQLLVRKDDSLPPGAVYELEDGSLVAIAFWQERTAANSLCCAIAAWQINPDGSPVEVDDVDGVVLVETRHNASAQQIGQLGVQGIASAMVGLVLGVSPGDNPPIPWSGQHWEVMNIRTAIAVAKAVRKTVAITL